MCYNSLAFVFSETWEKKATEQIFLQISHSLPSQLGKTDISLRAFIGFYLSWSLHYEYANIQQQPLFFSLWVSVVLLKTVEITCKSFGKLWCVCLVTQSFATPRTAAHRAPLSVGFPRQEYCSGLPFPPPSTVVQIKSKMWSSMNQYKIK